VSTHGLNTQAACVCRSEGVVVARPRDHFTATRAHCTRPYDQGGLIQLQILSLLFVKGFDSTDVCHIVNYSFLEANRSVVINLCDLVGTIAL
jgi:hypothetical protein